SMGARRLWGALVYARGVACTFRMGDLEIWPSSRCFVIAEVGVNHNGDLEPLCPRPHFKRPVMRRNVGDLQPGWLRGSKVVDVPTNGSLTAEAVRTTLDSPTRTRLAGT